MICCPRHQAGVTPVSKQPLVSDQMPDCLRDTANDSVSSKLSPSQRSHPPASTSSPYFPNHSSTQQSRLGGSHMKKIARPFKQPLKWEESELEDNRRTPHPLQSPSMIVIVRLCQFLRPFLWKVRWSCGQFHHGGGTQKLYFMTILTPGRKHPTPLWPSIPSPS